MTWDEEVDVVVIGAGTAGLCAGIAARKAGLDVALLEKEDKIGGGTCYSWGFFWAAPNHLADAEGLHDDPGDVARYMDFLAGGEAEPERMEAFVARTPEVLRFFEDCGIPFHLDHGVTDHYHGMAPGSRAEGRTFETGLFDGTQLGAWQDRVLTPPAPYRLMAEELVSWGGMNNAANWDPDVVAEREAGDVRGLGVGLISHLLKAFLDTGAEPRTGAGVAALLRQGSRVAGVRTTQGQRIKARRGVVIATGGYESDDDAVKAYEGLPNWRSMFPKGLTGDGLKLGTQVGAAIRSIRNNMSLFLGYEIPGDEPEFRLAGIIELCSPHTLVVNDQGRRFADESFFPGIIPELMRFDARRHRYANLPCYLIFDQQYINTYSFLGKPPGAPAPNWLTRADSLEALAGRLGIDGDGVAATAARFNGFAETGRDEDFARGEVAWSLAREEQRQGNKSLGAVATPPFYGVELHPSALSSAGLAADRQGRVLDARDRPIAGLYASGNAAARTEYGAGYQAGHSLSSAMTFSYLAVQHMVGARARGRAH